MPCLGETTNFYRCYTWCLQLTRHTRAKMATAFCREIFGLWWCFICSWCISCFVKLQNPSGLVWPNDRLWRNCGIVNPYAIVFLFPPVPAILEAIIFEIMRCSKHPSKHPNIQACSKHPSTHPNIHPSISMHRSIQTSKQSSQFTNSTPQPTRQRNEASLKGAPRRILILNSPKPFKIMRLLKGIWPAWWCMAGKHGCQHGWCIAGKQ